MDLLKKIKDKDPQYDAIYEGMIAKFTLLQGGRAGSGNITTAWEQGKYFTTKYEIYMYATLLGLKSDYRIPLGNKKEDFMEIKGWQHQDLVDYILMALLAKSNIDFVELENKEDKEIDQYSLSIRKLMEEYANGGFDKIRAKLEQDPSFFENNENCFIDLLDNNAIS